MLYLYVDGNFPGRIDCCADTGGGGCADHCQPGFAYAGVFAGGWGAEAGACDWWGGIARAYQQAYRSLVAEPSHVAQDWIGIMATRVNAELLRAALGELCADPVLSDPTAEVSFGGRVLVGAGWKPGFSTDYIAVLLAEHFGAQRIINISNIEKVYSSDPALDPDARPLDRISWAEYQALIGTEWKPGRNLPFDPVASKRAAELGMEVLLVSGKDMANITMVLEGREFFGSRIGN